MHSPYYDDAMKTHVHEGFHREAVGGLWQEMAELQLQFLQLQGLKPHHRLLDIGCGSLRLGHKAIDYLEPAHYFGIDLLEDLLEAGYQHELPPALRTKLPRHHLHATDAFDLAFLAPHLMDYAMAQSVFSHLPLNHLRDCLMKLAPHMSAGGIFFATFFECPAEHPLHEPFVQPVSQTSGVGVTTHAAKDPYHYRPEDLAYAAKDTPFTLDLIGDWQHPRNQKMAAFTRQ